MTEPKIYIIILNWNNYQDTAECLSSLLTVKTPAHEVILVDNASSDGSIDKLGTEFPSVRIIRNKANLGFAGGNNIGIKAALNGGSDLVLLLNNDTTVEPDFLGKLVEAAKADDKVGLLSPKIMFYRDKSRFWFAGGEYLPWLRKPNHRYYGQTDRGQVAAVKNVAWISGCCMLIKREVLEQIGLLDGDFFLYNEDVDFCFRARRAGFSIELVPQAKIYHKFAASSGGKYSANSVYYRVRNNLLFFKKTGQFWPLLFNLAVFPAVVLLDAIRHRAFGSLASVWLAEADFFLGRVGRKG